MNTPLDRNEDIDILSNLPTERLHHPLIWLEEGAEVDEENFKLIRKMVITPINATKGVQWTAVALGLGAFIGGVVFLIWFR